MQPIGPELLPIAYISKQLDPTARGWFPCLRALVAETTLYADAKKLIHGQPLTIISPHRLGDLLASKFLSDLSKSRLQQFHLVFLDNLQVSVGRSPQLNPLSLLPSLPLSSKPPAHSCSEVLESFLQPPHNLFSEPLPDPELTLFVNESSKRDPDGNRRAAYAVVTTQEVLEAQPLPPGTTSQKAELTALTRALRLAEGKGPISTQTPNMPP